MNTKQRILSIRLAEKISSQPDFAKAIGISVIQKVNEKGGVIHESTSSTRYEKCPDKK